MTSYAAREDYVGWCGRIARKPKRVSAENGAKDSLLLGERVWGNPGRVFGGFPQARGRESGARAPHRGACRVGRTYTICRAICRVDLAIIFIIVAWICRVDIR